LNKRLTFGRVLFQTTLRCQEIQKAGHIYGLPLLFALGLEPAIPSAWIEASIGLRAIRACNL
jgi:hypothetical protein